MILQIPLAPSLSAYTEQVTLGGLLYTLAFRWNTRASAWFMTITDDADQVVLVPPRRVVSGSSLNYQFMHATDAPRGSFLAIDTLHRDADPGLADLGTRILLLYGEPA